MDITIAQQKALDDDLEPTLQVVLDALKLTSFYKAFEITADVPEICMQEFRVTSFRHHSSLCFKMNGKSHTFNVDNFRDMLKIFPKLLGQNFEDPPFEEEILSFIRDLGHTSEIKVLSDVNHAYAIGEKIPKPKYVKNKADTESSPKKKCAQASEGKRLKTSAKVTKPANKKQPTTTSKAKILNVLSEVALSEVEQMKLATKRSKIQFHSSCASGSGADEGTSVTPWVPDVPTYDSKEEQISWKSNDEDDDDEVNMSEDDDNQNDANTDNEDADNQNDDNADNEGDDHQDDDNEQTDSENDDDDFIHPKLSTFDEKERQDEEDKEEEWSDDEAYDDETQGVNVEGEELDEEDTNKEDKVNELYRDVNVNLEGRDTEMEDVPHTNVQGFISNMLNPNPDTGIDFILNLNIESTSLVDVPVTTNVEMPPSSVTTLPPPPIPFIQPQQQIPVLTPTIVPSISLQNLPTFGSLFKFEDRVKALEDDFSEFKQTNQFATAVSLIPGIVDTYLANKMNEAIKLVVQLQSDKLRTEAQVDNEDFINKIKENMKKIIKEQVK
ncbi:hypothetical protein Tco_0660368, partial [Tanacetum coccineum]